MLPNQIAHTRAETPPLFLIAEHQLCVQLFVVAVATKQWQLK